ncbi:MAG: sulfatase [Microthrixaceae bacterium]
MNSQMGSSRPNIVMIVADDHGREAVGCYGNPVVSTPNIDALADRGVRFENAFCTTASCSASRSVILSGLHNHTNRTFGLIHDPHNFSMSSQVVTLPALMKQAGYRTGRMGKKHYQPEELFPFDFDPPEWGTDEDILRHRDDLWLAERCEDFVQGEAPYFLYWCSHDPHRNWERADHPLRPDDFGNPSVSFPGDRETPVDPEQVIVPPWLADLPEVRAELAEYYQSIARLDRGVGRLVDLIRQSGTDRDTIVLYLSDNGGAFPVAKTTLYEPGMQLPLIVARIPPLNGAPLSVDGSSCSALVTWADLAPTVLDLAGAKELGSHMFGDSMCPLLEQPESAGREHVFASHCFHQVTNYYPMRVVRSQRYKFIYNIAWKLDFPTASDIHMSASWQSTLRESSTLGQREVDAYVHRPRFELYDLQEDPSELHNLAEEEDRAAQVADFVTLLQNFQIETSDPWFHKWIYE